MERMWVNVPPWHKKEALRISATSSTDSTELINKLGNVTPAQIFGKQEPVYLQTRLINHEHRRSTVQSRHHDWIIQITFLQTTNTFIRLHILYLHLYNTHSDTHVSEPTLISAPLDLCFLVPRQKRNVAAHTAETFIRTGPNKSHMVRVWIRFRLVLVYGMTRLHLRWTRPVQILLCGLGLGKVHHFHMLTYLLSLLTLNHNLDANLRLRL